MLQRAAMAASVWTSETLYPKMGIKWIVLYRNKRDLDQGIIVYLVKGYNKGQTVPKKQ